MASHPPPFQVEDNTDEDFFDNLVNDDYDVSSEATASAASGGHSLTAGKESHDAKAFSYSSEDEQGPDDEVNLEHQHISGGNHGSVSDLTTNEETVEHINHVENERGGADVSSDSVVVSNGSGESGIPAVKEVGWSAFHAHSVDNDSNDFGSYSDFFSEVGGEKDVNALGNMARDSENHEHLPGSANLNHSNNYEQYNNGYNDDHAAALSSDVHDLNSSQYWENQYPGWQYDPSAGQWYQVDGYDAGAGVQAKVDSYSSTGAADDMQSHSESVSNWNQASEVSDATVTPIAWNQVSQVSSGDDGVPSDWNQVSHDSNGYPPHMVFDPQYPGWYYDTISMEWRSLESYSTSVQSAAQIQGQMNQGTLESYSASAQSTAQGQGLMNHDALESYSSLSQSSVQFLGVANHGQHTSIGTYSQNHDLKYLPQGHQINTFGVNMNQMGSVSNNYQQQSSDVQPHQTLGSSHATALYGGSIQNLNLRRQNASVSGSQHPNQYKHNVSVSNPVSVTTPGSQQKSVHYGVEGLYHENLSQDHNNFSMPSMFDIGGNLNQQFNDSQINQNDQKSFSNDYYSQQRPVNFSEQQFQNAQITYTPASGRSSAGRPAHALVTFGFGGKLIVMKHNNYAENLNFGSQNPVGGTISVLNLVEVVSGNLDTSYHMGVSNYFQALCRQSIPGPLTGGSVGTKELNKWIDERITNLGSTNMDYGKAEVLSLLLSLLKILCQYYGKLRSPYGTDAQLKESDAPELAIAKLFTSAKRNGAQFSQYGAVAQCLQQMPSEGQLQVTAAEVQNLLVSGRKKEALQCAQEGQLWGPALVLAAQLNDQFYAETVKQMALRQFAAGSPLRTLCLLIAGQPADVFSVDSTSISGMPGALNAPQQAAQFGTNAMLDDWQENLAVITANRTKDDELVLIHLGDCLWKERSDIIAAHICYLVAEASFEPYSDSARFCLLGADHWKLPRTYASPEAIQRTEIYEYSKMLGNSQFTLLPFQPYKFVYALMLTEVGRISEALKYCQAVSKSLKTGRTPEVETLRHLVSSLEERIKAHQQGGFSSNLAPKEFIGKLLKVFDSTAHRVVGGLPPPVPTARGTLHGNEDHHQSIGPRVSTSQSTMAMSSLVPSQSMEPISELAGDSNRMVMHTRSVSEPNFGRSPLQGQADSMKETSSTGEQDKASAASTTSRFGRFGFGSQLFQKTVGLVFKNHRQAKLGDTNKFYYDEKLKRWVEEGAEPPTAETALPPPPPTTSFQNGASDYNLKSALQNEASLSNRNTESKMPSAPDNNSGMPPLPPTTNQYSARGRMGVRSRYVDTFNQGGGNTSAFRSPPVPSVKPATGVNPKFFVPTPVSTVEKPIETPVNSTEENTRSTYENFSSSPVNDSLTSPASPSVSMQRFPSMNDIPAKGKSDHGSFPTHSRRTASWSGSFNEPFSPSPRRAQVKSLGEVLDTYPSSTKLSDPSSAFSSSEGGSVGEDLHEVKL